MLYVDQIGARSMLHVVCCMSYVVCRVLYDMLYSIC
jgi:hypothetical protein